MVHSTSKFIAQLKVLLAISFFILGSGISGTYAIQGNKNESKEKPYQLIIIDKSIEDQNTIVDAIDFSGNVILKVIDDQSPVENQLEEIQKTALKQRFQTVNIFSHGKSGEIQLGGQIIDIGNRIENASFFQSLNQLTDQNSTISFYACEAAKGIEGQKLFQELSAVLDANIALSNNITGVSGDWNLEVKENKATQSGVDLNFLSNHYSANLQLVNDPYCITQFATFTGKATEMTVDWKHDLLYFAGENVLGRLYRVNSDGVVTRISSNFVNSVNSSLLFNYISTDIVYYNDSIFTNSSGSLIMVDLSPSVTSSNPYIFPGDNGAEAGMAVVGDKIYTTDGKGTANSIYEYDIATNTSQVVVTGLPADTLHGLEYCEATNKLYLAISPLGIYEVDVTAGTYTLVTDPLPNTSRSNFAVDPTGAYAYVHNGSTVYRYNLSTGVGEIFASGLVASNFCDLKFGPSSHNPVGYSLYIGGNDRIYEVVGFVPAVPADMPTLTATEPVICPLGTQTTTISVSASDKLNGATAWYLYTGSCGGTLVESNTTGTFTVTPTTTTTYYVRGEGECNVAPGACGTITIIYGNIKPPTADLSHVECYGESNGEIVIFATGGTAPYQYSIDNGVTFQPANYFTNLTAGVYNLVVKESNGCINIASVELNQPDPLIFTYTVSDAQCNGGNDGTIIITASGGYNAGYEYSVDGGTSWQISNSFLNLPAGTYSVMVRDRIYNYPIKEKNTAASVSCETAPVSVSIGEPTVIVFTITQTEVSCNGGNDGSITFSASGGSSGIYQYSIDGGVNFLDSNVFSGLVAGDYQTVVREKDNTSCEVFGDLVTITEPTVIAFTTTQSNINCNSNANGQIVVTATGGVGGAGTGVLDYSNDGGVNWQSSNIFDNLPAGDYDIVVRDHGQTACVTSPLTISITEPTPLAFTVDQVNVSCFGNNDGQIIMNASGGVGGDGSGTYEYSIDGGVNWQATNTFNSLFAATYQLILRDAVVTSCTTTITDVEITQPDLLELSFTKVDANCSTNNDGEIHLSAVGGTGGTASGIFEYTIDGSSWQDSGDFTGLASANYSVAVRDKMNPFCGSILQNVFIDLVSPITTSYTYTEISCYGGNDGNIEITASGGTGYEYSIGNDVWQDAGLFENLSAGNYSLIAREKTNSTCGSTPIDLSLGEPTELTFTTSVTQATCTAGNDGEIVVTASGGVGGAGSGTYEYSKDGLVWGDNNTFSGLVPQNYYITIRDKVNPGCEAPGVTIAINKYSAVDVSVVATGITCFGANDGSIDITATGGAGYEYSIDNGINWVATNLFEGLVPGTYSIVVREGASPACTTEPVVVTIDEPSEITFTFTKTDISCFEGNDGSIVVSASGGVGGAGTGTYEYSKDGGTTWQSESSFLNLTAATYSIVVRDAGAVSCMTAAQDAILTQPTALVFSVGTIDLTCYGSADGVISVSATGGTGGNASGVFEYSIDGSTWQDSNLFNGLDAATYQVSVRDKNHISCQAAAQAIVLGQPTELTFTSSFTHATCGVGNDGEIVLTASGGESGTYDYSLDGTVWQASNTFSGLGAGTYSAMIHDKANPSCVSVSEEIKIINLSPIDFTHTFLDVSCPGAADGEIVITVSGISSYDYSIDDGITWQASNSFLGLSGGHYELAVRDQATPTCQSLSTPQDIAEADALVFTYTSLDESCNGGNDGRIEITASGGSSATYEYTIDGVSWVDSGLFENLNAGDYHLNIRDKASTACTSTQVDISLIKASAIGFETTTTPVSCNGFNDGEILVTKTVGNASATYEYSIDNGSNWQLSNVFANLTAGFYFVGIREQGSTDCQPAFKGVLLSDPAKISLSIVRKHVSCGATNDGEIAITATGPIVGVAEYTIDGGATFQTSNTFTGLSVGTYLVFARDSAFPDCSSDTYTVLIETRSELNFNVSHTNTTCFGGANGTITVGLSVGMNPADFEFSIDDGANWQASNYFDGLSAGTYPVIIKEIGANTCPSYPQNTIIGEPSEMTMTPNIFYGDCSGSLGSIEVNAPLSYGTLLYSIDNGLSYQTNKTFDNLSSGTYHLQIKNMSGCVGHYTENPIELKLASEVAVTISADPTGNICTYYPIVLTAEGSDIESYSWSTGETTKSINYSTNTPGIHNFTVDVVGTHGCSTSDAIDLDFRAGSAISITAVPNDTVCAKDPIELTALATDAVSYLWNPDNVASNTITVKMDDWGQYMYYVEVTNNIGCVSMDSIQLVFKDCTGLNELDTDGVDINVYPNPSYNGQFKVEISGLQEDVDLWIIDFDGRLILEDKILFDNSPKLQKQFDLQRFGRGVYFIRIANDKKVTYKRIILM